MSSRLYNNGRVSARYSKSRNRVIVSYLKDYKAELLDAWKKDTKAFYNLANTIITSADSGISSDDKAYFTRVALEIIGLY